LIAIVNYHRHDVQILLWKLRKNDGNFKKSEIADFNKVFFTVIAKEQESMACTHSLLQVKFCSIQVSVGLN
jgi:hypothetical protein